MEKTRKTRAKFDKSMSGSAKSWNVPSSEDVFSLPKLPPGKKEHAEFNPDVIPPNCDEFAIFEAIWNEKLHEQFIHDLNRHGNFNYGTAHSKRWTVTKSDGYINIGIMLLIRADYSARNKVIDELKRKLVRDTLEATVREALDFVASKFPQSKHLIPGDDFIRRFIAQCQFSSKSESILNRNLVAGIKIGCGGRIVSSDEKGAKFTGNSGDLLDANKPESHIVSWHADMAVETRHNEPFVVQIHTHRDDRDGPQSIWDEFYGAWAEAYKSIAHEATAIITDSHYMCEEVVTKAMASGISFICGFAVNKFKAVTSLIGGQANKAREHISLYDSSRNLLIMKRTDNGGKTKFSISNYMVHSRGHPRKGDLHQWDAYNEGYNLDDRFHAQMEIQQHRRWPFRHGSNGRPGMEAHVFDIIMCFIIEDSRVAYRAVRSNDIERPNYSDFLSVIALRMIEKGLKLAETEKK